MRATVWVVAALLVGLVACGPRKATKTGPVVMGGGGGDDVAEGGGSATSQTLAAGTTVTLTVGEVVNVRSPIPVNRVSNSGPGALRVSVHEAQQRLELGGKKPGKYSVSILDEKTRQPRLEFFVVVEPAD